MIRASGGFGIQVGGVGVLPAQQVVVHDQDAEHRSHQSSHTTQEVHDRGLVAPDFPGQHRDRQHRGDDAPGAK
ncbi:Uncharacterised protein [Mycobacteroides abscessus subsp. abscessus]|nr:Uncharacterised protein [Mycobacteroides abscessus subsp. abscessus]